VQAFDPINRTVIFWDLEIVPDLRGFAATNDLVGKTDDKVREAIGDKFPKHIYHSIVCIGILVAHKKSDPWTWMHSARPTPESRPIDLGFSPIKL
jgi:hypothetical protein